MSYWHLGPMPGHPYAPDSFWNQPCTLCGLPRRECKGKMMPDTKSDADPILKHFNCDHLPQPLREVSRAFYSLAHITIVPLPRGAERSTALRKLLEAKDAAVRAAMEGLPAAGTVRE